MDEVTSSECGYEMKRCSYSNTWQNRLQPKTGQERYISHFILIKATIFQKILNKRASKTGAPYFI